MQFLTYNSQPIGWNTKAPETPKARGFEDLKTYYRSLWFPFQHHQSQSATNPSYKNPQTIEEGSQERLLKVFSIVILIAGAAHSLITLQLVPWCRWISPASGNQWLPPDKCSHHKDRTRGSGELIRKRGMNEIFWIPQKWPEGREGSVSSQKT